MPQRGRAGGRDRVGVAAAAARDHVAAVGEERPVAGEHDPAARRAEAFEQAQRVRDHRLLDARQVVARDLRVVHREHRPEAGVGVAAVVLQVDDDEGGARSSRPRTAARACASRGTSRASRWAGGRSSVIADAAVGPVALRQRRVARGAPARLSLVELEAEPRSRTAARRSRSRHEARSERARRAARAPSTPGCRSWAPPCRRVGRPCR